MIQPAGRAFAIWGVIYSLILVFAVYQALPDSWTQQNSCLKTARNNELIFGKIGYVFFINMLLNAAWLVVFGQNELWAFCLSWCIIVGMVITQTIIMRLAVRNELNIVEYIGLKVGFSIYNGWVSAATILNTAFVIKSADIGFFMDHEVGWGVIMLWVALVLYCTVSTLEKNPIYGAVYLWVLFNINDKSEEKAIQDHSLYILVIHAAFIIGLTANLWRVSKN